MRKKSHISLAKYLVDSMDIQALHRHRKAFCLGNVLPDCQPSFVTTRHEYNLTFHKVKEDMRDLISFESGYTSAGRVYFRDLGQVIHYIADYFTFPHNDTYEGSLKDHCIYEKKLKHKLREFILSGEAKRQQSEGIMFSNFDELITFIKDMHKEYTKYPRSVEEDCIFILNLCSQVVFGILYLLSTALEQNMELVFA